MADIIITKLLQGKRTAFITVASSCVVTEADDRFDNNSKKRWCKNLQELMPCPDRQDLDLFANAILSWIILNCVNKLLLNTLSTLYQQYVWRHVIVIALWFPVNSHKLYYSVLNYEGRTGISYCTTFLLYKQKTEQKQGMRRYSLCLWCSKGPCSRQWLFHNMRA